MSESKLKDALQLTSEIFRNVEQGAHRYKGYEVVWAIYNLVHVRFSIPFCEIRGKLERSSVVNLDSLDHRYHEAARIFAAAMGKPLTGGNGIESRGLVKEMGRVCSLGKDVILAAFSIVSILIGRFGNSRKVAVWTGDFFDEDTGGDFRLGSLYKELRASGVFPIDFIRQDMNGFANTLKNMLRRRRPAVYYSSIDALVRRVTAKKALSIGLKRENRLHRHVLQNYFSALQGYDDIIGVFEWLFGFLGIKSFLAWEFSDRQAHLILAAKCQGIRVIGFQHGAGMETYMAHEFIREFSGAQRIGPDFMGVWSEFWMEYFNARSRLYGSVEVSGPIRPIIKSGKVSHQLGRVQRVLWISEPLADVKELEPYILHLHSNYRLLIRKRPSTEDIFFKKLVERQPKLAACETSGGGIAQAVSGVDLVVGSHSTAVLEAAVLGIPLLLIKTRRWGDYFELGTKVRDYHIVVESVESLQKSISQLGGRDLTNALDEIATKYLGAGQKAGTEWLVHRIEECLAS